MASYPGDMGKQSWDGWICTISNNRVQTVFYTVVNGFEFSIHIDPIVIMTEFYVIIFIINWTTHQLEIVPSRLGGIFF